MADDRALVRNAADREQVRRGARLSERRRTRELEDLRAVLGTPEGRRFVWRLLEHCGVYKSIWDPSSRIHYQAGKQDVGHYLMAEIAEANEDALFVLMREARVRQRSEEAENDAARTPRAGDQEQQEETDG